MAIDITNTHQLIMAVEEMPKSTSFLRDRYFPTNESTDIFSTYDVLVDYKEGRKKLAPFVAPRKGGKTIMRKGFTTTSYTPPLIAPIRPMTADDLKKRGFGEALYSKLTAEERQNMMALKDIDEQSEMITNREEWMCAKALFENGYIMKAYVDGVETEDSEIHFYTEEKNPAVYTPSKPWSDPDADILGDIYNMAMMLKKRGLPAKDLICGSDVISYIESNTKIQKQLDNRRVEIGEVKPEELPEGASIYCRLNCKGIWITVFNYDETFENDEGVDESFVPTGYVCLTAPACGRTLYGAIDQLEEDGQFHTWASARVPKYLADRDSNIRKIGVSAAPLPVVNNKNPMVTAKVDDAKKQEA